MILHLKEKCRKRTIGNHIILNMANENVNILASRYELIYCSFVVQKTIGKEKCTNARQ